MSVIDALNTIALLDGGRLLTFPWSARQELRVDVKIGDDGGRRFNVRFWYLNREDAWRPSRNGFSAFSPGEVARLAECLRVVAAAARSIRRVRKVRAA